MSSNRFRMLSAEVFLLRSRISTWVLLAIWGALGLFFSYVLEYLTDEGIEAMLPDAFVRTMISGFPFYGGAIALMLGVLSIGSDFGWGTFKTLFSQRPGRGQVFAAKMGALAVMLAPFVVLMFVIGAVASAFIAWREGVAIVWPGLWTIVQALLAGWLILAVWAAVGVVLAVVTRGTSLAIGIGIIYTLVIEGLISAFANQISWLEPLIDAFLRANAYSLIRPLGGTGGEAGEGPGVFTGPFVSGTQALVVLVVYLIVFMGVSVWLLRRRDVD
ncbi:MAG: ABC transporter permease subunit [Chloroflexota bacterium]|nr:ABC transporter permease subunit [Chloroflexota bacterium]